MILFVATTLDEIAFNHTVDKFDGTIVLNFEPLRQVTNGDLLPRLRSFKRQQELMLLWLKTTPARGLFAEREKFTQLVAKLGQRLILSRA